MANSRITIRDVADVAGVSTATVSRFLNESGYVNDTTSARIRDAIAQTGYTPSLMARGLKTRRTGMLLLVVPDICNPFYSSMARRLQKLSREEGYVLVLADSAGDPDEELEALAIADRTQAEGVFFATIHDHPQANTRLKRAGCRVVGLNAFGEGAAFDTVAVHHHGGTNLAVGHLAQLGHRRIAFAGGMPGSLIASSRRDGYLHGMKKYGLEVAEDAILEIGFGQEDGYAAGRQFAARSNPPTALCCANDLVALGAIRALNEAGLSVPEDVSVTGMDDIPYAALSNPPLTTVTNDGALFAERAFEMMLDRLHGNAEPPRRAEIPNELVVRGSTAPARSK